MARLGNTTEVENPMVDDSKIWQADAEREALMRHAHCGNCAKCHVPIPDYDRNAEATRIVVREYSPYDPVSRLGNELAHRIFNELNYAQTLNCWCDAMSTFVGMDDPVDGCEDFEGQ